MTEDRKGKKTRSSDADSWLQRHGMLVIILLNVAILATAIVAQKLANDRYTEDINSTERRAEASRQVVLFVCEQLEEHRLFSNVHNEQAAIAHTQIYPPPGLPPHTLNGSDRCVRFRAEADRQALEDADD